ncbi:MAG: LamG-like jellyroll fold domain-containing protein [Candidatus Sumerlaeia bacterium]
MLSQHPKTGRLITSILIFAFCVLAPICSIHAQDNAFFWQEDYARLIPTGDLEWTPEPYTYKPGSTVRFIDYEAGDDNNSGDSKTAAWKHHPWDPAATGVARTGASGIDTYVFKGGVKYRGHMETPAGISGTELQPVQLTRDPTWGEGDAMIYGSQMITEGWQKGALHPDIPNAEMVWSIDLDFAPRAIWMVDGDEVTRIDLAKTPNWKVSDPEDVMSEWWEWTQPEWWKHMSVGDPRAKVEKKGWGIVGIDTKNLTEDADYYEDAIVRTEWGIVMSMPMPTRVEHFDPETKALSFATPFLGPGFLITGQRYFLEDKPHYLDQAGEYWFHKKGKGGTLYLRLPEDQNPNTATIEAAKYINAIDSDGMQNVRITGLTFRFSNYHWNIADFIFQHEDLLPACVRVLGPAENVEISHCKFEHVNKAIRLEGRKGTDTIDKIRITDNVIRYTDHGGIHVKSLSPRNGKEPSDFSRVIEVDLLRNNLYEIGLRFPHMGHEHAVNIRYPEVLHVAGNFLDRTYQGGMDIAGFKGHGQPVDAPFTRMLIHHNKVTDAILASNDWGALYVNQGGPGYVFDNVVRNPGGFANWRYRQNKKEGTPRFGHSYYLDGSYKKYVFNNIAWGKNNEQGSKYANESAFQTLISFENQIFNNTAYRFVQASRNQSGQLGRWLYIGNIYQDVSEYVFRHANPSKKADPNAADAGKQGDQFDYQTYGYKNNLFHGIAGHYGLFEASGKEYDSLENMRAAMKENNLMAWQLGEKVETAPLRDPENMDVRPVPRQADQTRAMKLFVPWALYAVVGEWHFLQNNEDPSHIIDQHWYMQPPYPEREYYIHMPRYPLKADWATADHFQQGSLENWTDGALDFSGKPAVLSQETIEQGATYTHKKEGEINVPGSEFKTVDMDSNNFLIEIYFRTATITPATLVSKMTEAAGYALSIDAEGKAVMTVQSHGKFYPVKSNATINDGEWHHIVAEVDRAGRMMKIYIDGRQDAESVLALDEMVSLKNSSDLIVGQDFTGAIDFLRISRGTIEQARTSIAEIYHWQFIDGPFLEDFTGRRRDWNNTAAGAIDF